MFRIALALMVKPVPNETEGIMTKAFDAVKYKATTYEQWQAAAEAWHRWGPTLSRWLGPATERMFDLAKVGSGCRVLDVAAGAARLGGWRGVSPAIRA